MNLRIKHPYICFSKVANFIDQELLAVILFLITFLSCSDIKQFGFSLRDTIVQEVLALMARDIQSPEVSLDGTWDVENVNTYKIAEVNGMN